MTLTYQKITKAEAVRRAKEHQAQDKLIRGIYWDGHRGCSIGCDVKTKDAPHKAWAELYGTPEAIPRLIDFLFERLPEADARAWHVRVRKAIPAGVDLKDVPRLHAQRCLTRCVGYVGEGDEPWRVECRGVVVHAAETLKTHWLTGEEAARAAAAAADAADVARAARAARAAAWTAAAADAAWTAARAADAAWTAAWTARAADAAWTEAWAAAAAADAAEAKEVRAQADDLLELLREVARG